MLTICSLSHCLHLILLLRFCIQFSLLSILPEFTIALTVSLLPAYPSIFQPTSLSLSPTLTHCDIKTPWLQSAVCCFTPVTIIHGQTLTWLAGYSFTRCYVHIASQPQLSTTLTVPVVIIGQRKEAPRLHSCLFLTQ